MSAGLCCTCHVGGLLLGIDIDRVREVLCQQTVTPVPLAGHGVSGLLNLRGRIITVVDVRELLGLPRRAGHEDAVHVIIQTDAEVASLVVDAAGDVVDVGVIDQVPPTVDRRLRSFLSGAFQLGGTLLLLLDTDRVTAALVGSGASL